MATTSERRAQQPFNIFTAMLSQDELAYELSRHLDVEEFVTLYSMSKRFHELVNQKMTTCLERNAETNAPESASVFPWRCYRRLCMYDPTRLELYTQRRVRDVPSPRWLRMVYFREETVDSIVLELAEAGHQLPLGTALVIKKLWFLMELPDTARRVGVAHNTAIWSNHELLLATLFLVKLDMRLTDPMDGSARLHMRKLLLAQQSMSTLAAVLERRELTDMHSFMRMFVEWRLRMTDPAPGETVFGVPVEHAGRLVQQGWNNRNADKGYLMPVDELIMREGIRRDLRLNRFYLDMVLWGYVDPVTNDNIWPPSMQREMEMRRQQRDQAARAEPESQNMLSCRGAGQSDVHMEQASPPLTAVSRCQPSAAPRSGCNAAEPAHNNDAMDMDEL